MPITIIFLLFSVSSSLSPLCHDRTVETIKSHLHNCHIVTAINNPSLLKDNDGAEIKTRQQPMSSSFLAPPLEIYKKSLERSEVEATSLQEDALQRKGTSFEVVVIEMKSVEKSELDDEFF
ncbi:BnaA09g53630D [Brassica napus]|uniref:BnaA09g53630D protein n=2 Tax=Brassica TaxID=3705 RepID=A0A078J9Q8_BRANA|nr:BnaA09g53630D [Brassica napus]